jgi:hypothetical protein
MTACGGLLVTTPDEADSSASASHDAAGLSDNTHTTPDASAMDSSVPMMDSSAATDSGCASCPSPGGTCGPSNVCPAGQTCVTWWIGPPENYRDECYPLCGCTSTDLCSCVAACACPSGDSCMPLEPGAGVYCLQQ